MLHFYIALIIICGRWPVFLVVYVSVAVPCFYINDQRTFSGAQDIDAFLRMFDIIAERFPLVHPSASTASAKTWSNPAHSDVSAMTGLTS